MPSSDYAPEPGGAPGGPSESGRPELPAAPAGSVFEWVQRGAALLAAGDAAAAAALLEHAVAAEPSSRSIHEALARAQFDAGQHARAAEQFGWIVARFPDDDYARFGCGLALQRAGDLPAAIEHLALAVAMRPDNRDYAAALRAARATLAARPMSNAGAGLAGSDQALAQAFDVALLDLDGVLYVGDAPVPHAAEALAAARGLGMRCAYVTNNALRTPEQVAARLQGLDIPAKPDEVVTSAQAAARILAERLPAGAPVLVTGGEGLRQAVAAVGLRQVAGADDDPAAVVLGYDPTLDYPRLTEAALAVRRGALFVACNRDATVPSERGPKPGMGALTSFLVTATGQEPIVAGKPERALHAESVRRSGARHPVVVGDRLDTDIEGAVRAGTPSLLVMTGVTDAAALLAAPPPLRPTFIAADLRGLLEPHPAAHSGRCGAARAEVSGGVLQVVAAGEASEAADLDALRAAASAAWDARDSGTEISSVAGLPSRWS